MQSEFRESMESISRKADVVIIGAGPVGCYTAALLGQAGLKVNVFERRQRKDLGKEIKYIHFDVRCYAPLGLPQPQKDAPFYVRTFEDMRQVPLTTRKSFSVNYPTDMLELPGFIEWMADFARKSGEVKIYYETPFEKAIIKENKIIGIQIKGMGSVLAPITIDCSGWHAFVRNSLPPECKISPLTLRPNRLFTVYMEEWQCSGDFPKESNTFVCFKGFANQLQSDTTLVGASTLAGMSQSKETQKRMADVHLPNVSHTVIGTYGGDVPFDFPPNSLVGDGFISIGDSAFQNKPFNGEGMSSGMQAAQIAVPVIISAIWNKDVSINALWEYNSNYFKTIGRDFAMIRGAGETIADLAPEDFDWMYRAQFLSQKDMLSTWTEYRVKKGPISLIKSLFKGVNNLAVFKKILKGLQLGMKLKKLYGQYPSKPEELPQWESKFKRIIQSK
jgi:flavin-dependent dehydrogenase